MCSACDRVVILCLRSIVASSLPNVSESMARVLQALVEMHTLHERTVIKVEDEMDEACLRVILVIQAGEY